MKCSDAWKLPISFDWEWNLFSDLQKLEAMEVTLSKARKAYPDCSAVASKLHAQLYNAEEQLRAQKHQASYLIHLTARTFPRGLHCLSMRLTTEYFALQPEQRKLPNSQNVRKLALYHYAIFSDNVLACAVLVNSTTSTSMVKVSSSLCAYTFQLSMWAWMHEKLKVISHRFSSSGNLN